MSDERRKATVADCAGCIRDKFNTPTTRCWSLASAVMVPKWRRRADSSGPAIRVELPNCYSEAGYTHTDRIGQSRSDWEGGDAA
jgi:hypothetical protein